MFEYYQMTLIYWLKTQVMIV